MISFWRAVDALKWRWRDKKIYTQLQTSPDVYVLTSPEKTDLVFVDVYILGGTIVEAAEYTGLTHLLEHYLMENMSHNLVDAVELNATVSAECMHIYCAVPYDRFVDFVPVFFAGIFSPQFAATAIFAQEKAAVLNEIQTNADDIEYKLEKAVFNNRCLSPHSGHFKSSLDAVPSVRSAELDTISALYAQLVQKNAVKIFISSYRPLPPNDIQQVLKNVVVGEGNPIQFPICEYSRKKVLVQPDETVTGSYVVFSFPWVTLRDDYVTRMSANFLIDSFFSWEADSLNQAVRAIGVYGFKYQLVKNYSEGLLTIVCNAPTEKVQQVVEIAKKHFANTKQRLPAAEHIAQLKTEAIAQHTQRWRSNERLDWIIDEVAFGVWKGGITEDIAAIKEVTTETVRAVAQKYFVADRVNVVIYGKTEGVDQEKILQLLDF